MQLKRLSSKFALVLRPTAARPAVSTVVVFSIVVPNDCATAAYLSFIPGPPACRGPSVDSIRVTLPVQR